MKNLLLSVCMVLVMGQIGVQAQIGATGPLITEYVAGAGGDVGNYSFIEIYNGTGADLFLEDYSIVMSPNGNWLTDKSLGATWGQIHLNGFPVPDKATGNPAEGGESVVLAPGEIYLYVNENAWNKLSTLLPNLPATGVYVSKSDWTTHINNWNGQGPGKTFVYISEADQAVTPVDVVGVAGITDEWGAGWGGLRKVFSRKANIVDPVKVFNSGEWTVADVSAADFSLASLSGLGVHPNPTTGIAGKRKLSFMVYPNPASSRIFIESGSQETFTVKILDIRGSVVLKQRADTEQGIDISGLAKGAYLINVTTKSGNYQEKLFVK
jgi:hypothetical protein